MPTEYEIIDTRNPDRFTGKDPETRIGIRSGNIPGSKNIFFREFINENYTFKNNDELLQIFNNQKINFNYNIINSCNSGMTATLAFVAEELLSIQKKAIYDGSWTEFVNWVEAFNSPKNNEKENQQNEDILNANENQKNEQQFDVTLLTPAYNPFKHKTVNKPQQQENELVVNRGRSSLKRSQKFFSFSFLENENEKINETDNTQIYTETLLPDVPRQRSCLKQSGKFSQSAKKKMSRSFFGRPLKPMNLNSSTNLMEKIYINNLKSSFKVNFNQQVRVERVESYKAFNVLEDELKKKIVRNSRFAQEENKQQQRSKQPSIAEAFGGGPSNDDKICCFIF